MDGPVGAGDTDTAFGGLEGDRAECSSLGVIVLAGEEAGPPGRRNYEHDPSYSMSGIFGVGNEGIEFGCVYSSSRAKSGSGSFAEVVCVLWG